MLGTGSHNAKVFFFFWGGALYAANECTPILLVLLLESGLTILKKADEALLLLEKF